MSILAPMFTSFLAKEIRPKIRGKSAYRIRTDKRFKERKLFAQSASPKTFVTVMATPQKCPPDCKRGRAQKVRGRCRPEVNLNQPMPSDGSSPSSGPSLPDIASLNSRLHTFLPSLNDTGRRSISGGGTAGWKRAHYQQDT